LFFQAVTILLVLDIRTEHWPFKEPFRIAGHVFTDASVVHVTLTDGDVTGEGEASGEFRAALMGLGVLLFAFEVGLVAALQAFIFATLTAIYLGGAVAEDH